MIKNRKTNFYLVIILVVGLAQWAFFFSQNALFSWDAAFYYGAARSLVFDRDLKLTNDLILSYPTASSDFVQKAYHNQFIRPNRIYYPFAIGTSLIWTPWITLVKVVNDLIGNVTAGFERVYLLGASSITIALGWAAFGIGFYLAQKDNEEQYALWGTLTLLFTTPLLYYLYQESGYSHGASAFATACVVLFWYQTRKKTSLKIGFATGTIIGLSALVRWQHAVYLILPISTILRFYKTNRDNFRLPLLYGLSVLAGTIIAFSPQLFIWKIFTGSWITIPQGESFMVWVPLYLPQFLFSTYRGVLFWMPIAFPSLIGLAYAARRKPARYLPLLLILLAEIYINASTPDWMGCGGFGPRRLSSELAILVIGYSTFISHLSKLSKFIPHILNLSLVAHQLILFRFALVEKMGGRALAKIQDVYLIVEAAPPLVFLHDLIGHAGDLLKPTPYIYPNSLSAQITTTQPIDLTPITIFLTVLAFTGCVYWLAHKIYSRINRDLGFKLLIGLAGAILAFDIWLYLFA